MPDNLKKRHPQDGDRIHVTQEWELDYWSKEFGITPEELIAAVSAVGDSADAVKKYIKK